METKIKHTPGPWGCVDVSNHAHDYRLTKVDGSALLVNAPYNDHSEQRANARLIASSPDLLRACKISEKFYKEELEAIGECDHSVNICRCDIALQLEELQSVIAKAEAK